ncbi:MAG: type I secretion system permease/ATPase [Rhodobacteraceae bacterium]|nr:type I secretion system permease/ATPase [Paracoccaceae bacterium]
MATLSDLERRNRLAPLGDAYRLYRRTFVPVVVLSFAANLLLFASPIYMLQVYDRVLSTRSLSTLVVVSMFGFGAIALLGILEFLRSRILSRVSVAFGQELSPKVLSRMLSAGPGVIEGNKSVMRDMDTMRDFLAGSALISAMDAPWTPLFILVLYMIDPWYGTLAVVGAVLLFGLAVASEWTTRKGMKEAQYALVSAHDQIATIARNADLVVSMGMQGPATRLWRQRFDAALGWQSEASERAGTIQNLTRFIRVALQSAVIGLGAILVIEGRITAGMIIAGSTLLGRSLTPVEQMIGQWRAFISFRAADERVRALLAAIPAETPGFELPTPKGTLDVHQLVVAAPGGKVALLKGVSFHIEAGQSLGVVGRSGSGKSTLLRALVGVWSPASGHVRIDGADVGQFPPRQKGQLFGYLPQDVELFSGTVAENISRLDPDDDQDVVDAAVAAGVHDLVLSLPEGYETKIGAGGHGLSGGQKQRVALARALYRWPSVIVLDEPNSNLDAQGEEALANTLRALRSNGRTVVVSTHKLNLLGQVDKILVLDEGQVKLFGSRDEILPQLLGPKSVPAQVRPVVGTLAPGGTAQ